MGIEALIPDQPVRRMRRELDGRLKGLQEQFRAQPTQAQRVLRDRLGPGWRLAHPVHGILVDLWHPQAVLAVVLDSRDHAQALYRRGVATILVDHQLVLSFPEQVVDQIRSTCDFLVKAPRSLGQVGQGSVPTYPRSIKERLQRSRTRSSWY